MILSMGANLTMKLKNKCLTLILLTINNLRRVIWSEKQRLKFPNWILIRPNQTKLKRQIMQLKLKLFNCQIITRKTFVLIIIMMKTVKLTIWIIKINYLIVLWWKLVKIKITQIMKHLVSIEIVTHLKTQLNLHI